MDGQQRFDRGTGESDISPRALAEALTDPEAAVTIDETVHAVSDEGGERVRTQVFRVRITVPLDDD